MIPTASSRARGYTLIELMIAVGLFAIIMTLASGAYLVMISINRQAQTVASGINNLSFGLEAMTRDIRTGSAYKCNGTGDCPSGGHSFTFTDKSGSTVTYDRGTQMGVNGDMVGAIRKNGVILTDPSVDIDAKSPAFYVVGTTPGDAQQPHMTIVVSGTVSAGQGKPSQAFTVETGATMRGTDI